MGTWKGFVLQRAPQGLAWFQVFAIFTFYHKPTSYKDKTMFILFYFFAKSRKEECMRKKTKVYEMFNNFIAYFVLS